MKKFLILLLILLASGHYTAHAHEISESSTATLLIHIDPDDVAVVGKPTTIHIDLTNSEKGFDLSKCACVFSIDQNEVKLLETPLSPANSLSIYNAEGVPFTFQNTGEYHLSVSGAPTTPNLFTPFDVEVHEEVVATSIASTYPSHTHGSPRLVLGEAVVFSALMLYFLLSHNGPKKKIEQKLLS